MKPDSQSLMEIFSLVLEKKDPAEREQYLIAACRENPEMRAQVEALLQAHEAAGEGFLKGTVVVTKPNLTIEEPGMMIGRYKLLQQIGEGGFGVVYMAEQQEPVQRRVALKIIKAGMDTKEVIARFEAERQALAMMDHPNIARVLDAGATEQGRPYFVMELVRGVPITEFCDQNKLSTQERLALFMKVCHGVQHAHQKGVIHRDLKPSNVLVCMHDDEPVPKVIDFGIAKALGHKLTDKTLFTRFEQMIGTPAYMSPEQAGLSGLDIDTQSDIYSLGVLLYVLLTGVTPLDDETLRKAAMDEVMKLIRETDPPKPSTRIKTFAGPRLTEIAHQRKTEPGGLSRLLHGDLDWIVMKCLEKDRRRRYETANGLAMDLHRYLNHEPVLAVAPSAIYLLGKFTRRNRVALATASAMLVLLIAGATISAWQAVRATRAERVQRELREKAQANERRALEAQANESRMRQKAEASEQKAQTEATKNAQIARFLKDMLEGVGPSVAMGRDTALVRDILDKTAERVGKELTNQPEVEIELCLTLSETYLDVASYTNAESMAQQALQKARTIYGNEHLVTAQALVDLGHAQRYVGKVEPGIQLLKEGLSLQRRLLPPNHHALARTIEATSNTLRRYGKIREAETLLREALKIKIGIYGEDNPILCSTLNNLAFILVGKKEYHEAERLYRKSLDLTERQFGLKHPDAGIALSRLGCMYAGIGKYTEGESLLRQALEILKKILGTNHLETTWTIHGLAYILEKQGKLGEAEMLYRESLAIRKNLFDVSNDNVIVAIGALAGNLRLQGKTGEVAKLNREMLEASLAQVPQNLEQYRLRGFKFARMGRWREAAADFTKVIELQATNHIDYHELAGLLIQCDDRDKYRQHCEKTLAQFSDTRDPLIAERMAKDCLMWPIGGVDFKSAKLLAETALERGSNRVERAYFFLVKGLAEYRLEFWATAEQWVTQALTTGKDAYLTCQSHLVLAMAQLKQGRTNQAYSSMMTAIAIDKEKLPKLASGDLGPGWTDWIYVQTFLKEARELFNQAGILQRDYRPASEEKPAALINTRSK